MSRQSVNPGVWKWEDSPDLVYDLFPTGLRAVHQALLQQRGGRPIVFKAHATNWDMQSPHRNDSRFLATNWCGAGGNGSCAKASPPFLPGVDLYRYLFTSGVPLLSHAHTSQHTQGRGRQCEVSVTNCPTRAGKKWGLDYIKQDHEGGGPAQSVGIEAGKQWYKAMGDGAAAAGAKVSYCGMVPRVLMNSVNIRASTHARASHDYVPGQEIGQWSIGGPAVFLWGLGLLPYRLRNIRTLIRSVG